MDRAVFSEYEPEGFFDEVFEAPGKARPHYKRLVRSIEALGHDELARRARLRDASFRTQRKWSISSPASTATAIARFFGSWNCPHSRSAANARIFRCSAAISDSRVGSVSIAAS